MSWSQSHHRLAAALCLILTTCGASAALAQDTYYMVESGWSCSSGQSCMDLYEFDLQAGTKVDISLLGISGNSVPRLALFAPGTPLSGTNLLTGTNRDLRCGGQNQELAPDPVLVIAGGVYTLAVVRDWGSSAGASGTYRLDVATDKTHIALGRTADDISSQAAGDACGPVPQGLLQVSGTWGCGNGVDCMDVYEISLTAGSALTVAVDQVSGASVPRLAVFGPGDSLAGRNLLTGTNLDRQCVGQNVADSAGPIIAVETGVYRVAVTRDWGSSAGAAGAYRLNLTCDRPYTLLGQVMDNVPSQAAGAGCLPVPAATYLASGAWTCGAGISCMDVFDFELEPGTALTVEVFGITGSSVPRLALFGPGVALNGLNLLTGANLDRECVGQNTADTFTIDLVEGGVYRLAAGRDWGSSAGAAGTYQLMVGADQGFLALGQTANDVGTAAAGSTCGTLVSASWEQTGSWTCGAGVSCMDVYELDIDAGTDLNIAVTSITGGSVPRLALFAPGTPLSGVNLLTGTNFDRECVGQNTNDFVTAVTAAVSGVYRLAVGRDWGSSAGANGTYRVSVMGSQIFHGLGQVFDNIASQAAGSTCTAAPAAFQSVSGSWNCGNGVSCMDVYEVRLHPGTNLSISVGSITGASVPRLALFAPGTPLSGTNLLTGTNLDRECVGQNTTDNVPSIRVAEEGVYLVAVGRDWGSSAGAAGTYTLALTADDGFEFLGAVANDIASQAAGTICTGDLQTSRFETVLGWNCAAGVTCQDVFRLDLEAGMELAISLTQITGLSVPRLALFAPGEALSGTNLLTAADLDRRCVGQNQNDVVTNVAIPTSGEYLLAVGRDWGLSAGATGTYRLTVDGSAIFDMTGQLANDQATQASGTACTSASAVDDEVPSPGTARLVSAVPNPFNPTTRIVFTLPQDGDVALRVYDLQGRLVRTLAGSRFSAGTHEVPWNGCDDDGAKVSSGIYFVRFATADAQSTMKVALLK